MMSKEIFAVVLLGLTGCFSAMALHTGNRPKNINKRQVENCVISEQLSTVEIKASDTLRLNEFEAKIASELFMEALSAKGRRHAFPFQNKLFLKDQNSDNYELVIRAYNVTSGSCSQPQRVTLEPFVIAGEIGQSLFKLKGESDLFLISVPNLSRHPLVKILEDLKKVTTVDWGMQGFQWRVNNETIQCE